MIGDDAKFDKPGLGRGLIQGGRISGIFHFDCFVLAFRLAIQHGVVEVEPSGLIPVQQILSTIILEDNGHRKGRCVRAFSLNIELQFKLVKIFGINLKVYGVIPGPVFDSKILLITFEREGRILDFYQFRYLPMNNLANFRYVMSLKYFAYHMPKVKSNYYITNIILIIKFVVYITGKLQIIVYIRTPNSNYMSPHPRIGIRTTAIIIIITLALLPSVYSLVLFQRSDSFGAFQIKLFNPNDFLSSTTNKRFSFSNVYNYPNINIIGMALNGLNTSSLPTLNFTAEPSYSFSNNSFFVTLIVDPSNTAGLTLLAYSVIVVDRTAAPFMDLQNQCFLPNKVTVTNTSSYTQSLTLTAPNLLSPATSNVQVALFLKSIRVVSATNYSYFNTTKVAYGGSGRANFQLIVRYALIQEFCLTAVFCDYDIMGQDVMLNASIGHSWVNSSIVTMTLEAKVSNKMDIRSVYGPVFNYKCAIGLNAFQILASNTTSITSLIFDFTITPTVPSNYIPAPTLSYALNYSTFCFVQLQCQFLYQQYYVTINDCQDTCSIPFCSTCTTAYSCSVCQPGYFVDSLLRCQQCIGNCSICSNTITCDTCLSGFFFNSTVNQCQQCPTNCLTCSATTCTSCVNGYYPQGKLCILCQNTIARCLTCKTSILCTQCEVTYALSAAQNVCVACSSIANCLECSLYYKCDVCKPLFYQSGFGCRPCTFTLAQCCPQYIPNCAVCQSGTVCSGCAANYFFAANDTTNTTCVACADLVLNCSQCSSSSTCAICQTGFYLNNSTCLLCANAIPNCLTCYSSILCATCSNGLIVINGSCAPCPAAYNRSDLFFVLNNQCQICSTGVANCYRCSDISTCVQCLSGYYLSNSSCLLCGAMMRNCLVCVDSLQCLGCEAGTFLNGSVCQQCSSKMPGCVTCQGNATSAFCLGCSQQSYLNSGGCVQCLASIPNCQKCSNSSFCQLCSPGYFLSSTSTCSLCPLSFCLVCATGLTCATCQPTYYLSPSTLTCSSCSVLANCLQCLNSTFCSKCTSNMYYLTTTGECLECFGAMANCITCMSAGVCLSCLTGFYVVSNATNGTAGCVACAGNMTNCLVCSPNSTCLTCMRSYYISFGLCKSCSRLILQCSLCLNDTFCTSCNPGHYIIPPDPAVPNPNSLLNNCTPCLTTINNCQQCLNQTYCSVCNTGYFPDALGRCALCLNYIGFCVECTNGSVCGRCAEGYVVDKGGCATCVPAVGNCLACANALSPNICGQCAVGYYLVSNGTCLACSQAMANCQQCPSASLCTSCLPKHYPNALSSQCLPCSPQCASCLTSGQCLTCASSFFPQTVNSTLVCTPCIANCSVCANNVSCETCQGGYFLNGEFTCTSCGSVMEGCLVCYGPGNCTIRAGGTGSSEQGTQKWWLILAIIGIVMLVAACLLCLICYCCCKDKQQQQAKDNNSAEARSLQPTNRAMAGPSEHEFDVPHDGLCKLCGQGKLQIMNIELVCSVCEFRIKKGSKMEPLREPLRREIVFSQTEVEGQGEGEEGTA